MAATRSEVSELIGTLDHYTTPLDPSRTDLAREFRRRIYGIHSPELQVLLNRMRSLPLEGKHLLITLEPGKRWMLGRMYLDPLRVERLPEHEFESIEAAEWFVFGLRWEMLCGEPLRLDDEDDRQ